MKKLYLLPLAFLFFSALASTAPNSQDNTVHLIRMNLYGFNTDGSIYRLDGTFAQYGDEYSDAIDVEDGRKMTNPGVNVCLLRNNINLVVERRHTITGEDTLFFNIWGLQKSTYLLKFVGLNLNQEGLTAYLEDSYLHTTEPVSLDDTTDIKIDINNDAPSFNPTRFRLIFKMDEVVPVVHFTAISGQQVLLNWTGRNTGSVEKYQVQRSLNGTDFSDIGTVTSTGFHSENFQWADPFPTAGFNYYRIKSSLSNGEVSYSDIKVTKAQQISQTMQLFPNPAKADNMNLKMDNQPAGKYQVTIFNSFGQALMQTSFDFAGGEGVQKIHNNQSLLPGIYHLKVIKPNGEKQVLEVLF